MAILVSNNPYRLGRALGSGTRPRLDGAELGVTVLAPASSNGEGGTSWKLAMQQWGTPDFGISADSAVAAGIDGEATHLDPPLRFRIRPGALRVRIAPQHPGASPSALEPDTPWRTIESLATFVLHGGPSTHPAITERPTGVSRGPARVVRASPGSTCVPPCARPGHERLSP